MTVKIVLGDLIGNNLEEDFKSFDLTEIQSVLSNLQNNDPIDLAHAELCQQQTLRALDIISEYNGKITKTVSYLESKVNSIKNKVALEYTSPDGSRVTMEMRKFASESSSEVEEFQIKLAQAKGSKLLLEKKFATLLAAHYHYKEIVTGFKKTLVANNPVNGMIREKVPEGWE